MTSHGRLGLCVDKTQVLNDAAEALLMVLISLGSVDAISSSSMLYLEKGVKSPFPDQNCAPLSQTTYFDGKLPKKPR